MKAALPMVVRLFVARLLFQNNHLQFRKFCNPLEIGFIKSIQLIAMPFCDGGMEAVVDVLEAQLLSQYNSPLHFDHIITYRMVFQKFKYCFFYFLSRLTQSL
ncbi:hypothetical protein SAMN05216327_11464 [Dyadobacter sp. SG02]|nr:hypothetical protein SAMN05216327_11464 [Dyadobacter sp. SG02]